MKEYILILSVLLFSACPARAAEEKWLTTGSRHFLIYYRQAPEGLLERVSRQSEEYYTRITEALGFTRYNFWLGGNRARIYIYDSAEEYRKYSGQPVWSYGCVFIPDKKICSFSQGWDTFSSVLAHEIGHIIFHECLEMEKGSLPLWLDEGVACYAENPARCREASVFLKAAHHKGGILTFDQLAAFIPAAAGEESIRIFYAESSSVVGYLFEKFGRDNFADFCEEFKRGRDLDKALRSAYGLAGSADLEKSWRRYLGIL